MNKIAFSGLLLFLLIIAGCQKEKKDSITPESGSDSFKRKILTYIDGKKSKVSQDAKRRIETVKKNIDWQNFSTSVQPSTNYRQTTFKINGSKLYSKTETNTYTCLYVIQNAAGIIVNVTTLEISVPENNSSHLNALALDLVNNHLNYYTGKLTKRNLSGYYIFEMEIQNGEAEAFRYMKKKNTGGKFFKDALTENCVDWYWQTYVNGILVSEVFLFTDCGQEVEEGGSGNGGNGIPPADSTLNPCYHASKLEGDSAFNSQLSFLHTLTGLNYENGYVIGKDGAGQTVYQPIQGNVNQPSLPNLNFQFPVDGMMHSHFTGGFSIFSPADIRSLYNTFNDHMANPGFSFAVTTSTGTYVLQVTDVAAFLQYGSGHLADEPAFNEFQIDTYVTYGIYEMGGQASNETGFLNMIKSENMGLRLLSTSDFNNWDVKDIQNNTPFIVNC